MFNGSQLMPDHEISDVLSFGSIDEMSNNNKGAFGEALAGIWLKEQLTTDPSIITELEIAESDPRIWFSHLGRHRCTYGKVNDDGLEEISWEPDYSFNITLPDYDIRKEILVEAKTGNSGLKRDQLEMMEIVAQEDDTIVFLTRITFHETEASISYEAVGTSDLEDEIDEPDEYYECHDCGAEIDPDTAAMDLQDDEVVYICADGECQ